MDTVPEYKRAWLRNELYRSSREIAKKHPTICWPATYLLYKQYVILIMNKFTRQVTCNRLDYWLFYQGERRMW